MFGAGGWLIGALRVLSKITDVESLVTTAPAPLRCPLGMLPASVLVDTAFFIKLTENLRGKPSSLVPCCHGGRGAVLVLTEIGNF